MVHGRFAGVSITCLKIFYCRMMHKCFDAVRVIVPAVVTSVQEVNECRVVEFERMWASLGSHSLTLNRHFKNYDAQQIFKLLTFV